MRVIIPLHFMNRQKIVTGTKAMTYPFSTFSKKLNSPSHCSRFAPFLLVMWLSLFSCDKADKGRGIIYDYGEPAVDGCGWVIEINQLVYKPLELPNAYQVDGLEVEITYKILSTKSNCGFVVDAFNDVDLKSIELP